MACSYSAEGDRARARPLYERALAICEKALGPEHPSTATSRSNLAMVLAELEDFAAAAAVLDRARAASGAALGGARFGATGARGNPGAGLGLAGNGRPGSPLSAPPGFAEPSRGSGKPPRG